MLGLGLLKHSRSIYTDSPPEILDREQAEHQLMPGFFPLRLHSSMVYGEVRLKFTEYGRPEDLGANAKFGFVKAVCGDESL